MTSSRLVHLLYIAILTGSVERVRTESASLLSSSADRKDTENGGEIETGDRVSVEEDNTSVPDSTADKRKWGENTMMAWEGRMPWTAILSRDRRRWGEKSMSAWGKRRNGLGCEDDVANAEAATGRVEKRKWGEKTMQVWGKRPSPAAMSNDGDDLNEEGANMNVESQQKRKWGENSMSAWGKRQHGTDEVVDGDDKRKWGSNSMMVWGKREQLLDDDEPEVDDWSHTEVRRGTDVDAEINGVDDDAGKIHAGQKMAANRSNDNGSSSGYGQTVRSRGWHRRHGGAYWGPKRKWETNTMKVWGKRTSGGSDWRGLRTVDAE